MYSYLHSPLLHKKIWRPASSSTANAAAAAVTEEVAWNGNSHYNWNKFCYLTTNFCGIVIATNAISTMAATIYFAMVVLSIVIIHRRSQY
ncbi:hypothetical protein M5K25_011969 [Dendrobium thyrsiflorum]|uniref:PGG domain-containing protein n=1 Tax=Dendrobium thyrsiflorum TaxID=117978 RepID=A0ABD0V4J2_DENTH